MVPGGSPESETEARGPGLKSAGRKHEVRVEKGGALGALESAKGWDL